MLMLTLPNGEMQGDCKINGQACEYRIEKDRLSYRPKGGGEYTARTILQVNRGPKLTTFICTARDGGGGTVITPAMVVSRG